jgi:hypothetical protein
MLLLPSFFALCDPSEGVSGDDGTEEWASEGMGDDALFLKRDGLVVFF